MCQEQMSEQKDGRDVEEKIKNDHEVLGNEGAVLQIKVFRWEGSTVTSTFR